MAYSERYWWQSGPDKIVATIDFGDDSKIIYEDDDGLPKGEGWILKEDEIIDNFVVSSTMVKTDNLHFTYTVIFNTVIEQIWYRE